MIVSLFALAVGKLRTRVAAYSNKDFDKYFWNNLTPSGFYTPFLAEFLSFLAELQA